MNREPMVIKTLTKIAYYIDAKRIFEDWLDLMISAFMRDDPTYHAVLDKYPKRKEAAELFAQSLGELVHEMQRENEDILGQAYMLWNLNNKWSGQYFTPSNLCRLIAQISSPTGGRIGDPCCGSGTMLVETIKTMNGEQLNKSVFVGQDIDQVCVKMCALNLMFFNVNGIVLCGDSLSLDRPRLGYMTGRTTIGGEIKRMTEEELDRVAPYARALTEQSKAQGELFA